MPPRTCWSGWRTDDSADSSFFWEWHGPRQINWDFKAWFGHENYYLNLAYEVAEALAERWNGCSGGGFVTCAFVSRLTWSEMNFRDDPPGAAPNQRSMNQSSKRSDEAKWNISIWRLVRCWQMLADVGTAFLIMEAPNLPMGSMENLWKSGDFHRLGRVGFNLLFLVFGQRLGKIQHQTWSCCVI